MRITTKKNLILTTPILKKTNQTPNEKYKVKGDQETPDNKMAEKK